MRAFVGFVVVGWLLGAYQVYHGESRWMGALACLFIAGEFYFNGAAMTRKYLDIDRRDNP